MNTLEVSPIAHLPEIGGILGQFGYIPKIMNGSEADPRHSHFVVHLSNKTDGDKLICGGSILNAFYILTAAHCLINVTDDVTRGQIKVTAGDLVRGEDEGYEYERNISTVIIHEDYLPTRDINDIALVKLSKPLVFDEWIRPIDYQNEPIDYVGQGTVWGWGQTVYKGAQSKTLQRVDLTIQNCSAYYNSTHNLREEMMCAGIPGRDVCEGDSGGPLSGRLVVNSQVILMGIVSRGPKCYTGEDNQRKPGIYINVSKYGKWIDEKMGNGTYSSTQCSGTEFYYCKGTGKCIPSESLCDKSDDCGNNEDESACYTNCTSEQKYICKRRKECIPTSLVCDGQDDCGDNQDELNCGDAICSHNELRCKSSEKCVKKSSICDGDRDCPYSDDEESCFFAKNKIQRNVYFFEGIYDSLEGIYASLEGIYDSLEGIFSREFLVFEGIYDFFEGMFGF